MFLLLISISGIGPKLACNILYSTSVTGLRGAIAAGDTDTLRSLRGIGKKTADRLVLELKNKVGALALVSLGYKHGDTHKVVVAATEKTGPKATVEKLVRAALRSG